MDTLQTLTGGGGGTIILGWLTNSFPIPTFEHGLWLRVYLLFVLSIEVYKVSFIVSHFAMHMHKSWNRQSYLKLPQANPS